MSSPRFADPRLFQIAILASLLVLGIARFELAASVWQSATTITTALIAEAIFRRWRGVGFDWLRTWRGMSASRGQTRPLTPALTPDGGEGAQSGRWRALSTIGGEGWVRGRQPDIDSVIPRQILSPLITGLSLSLLLRTHEPLLWLAAPIIAIGSKSLFRVQGKHIFNPACFAIVTLLLTTHLVWVVPGQWGALAWGAAALASAAALVLSPTGRIDVAAAFLAGWAGLLAARCLRLGDPWAIPLHQMQSGVLLIFAFFMITDPRTTPDGRAGRIVFGLAVAALGHWFQFGWQMREGLFFALFIVSFVTPLLDKMLPDGRFRWTARLQEV